MPYANLTSVLDATATAPIMTAANALQVLLAAHSINLTPEEIGKMYKMETKRQSLGSRALQIATDNPTLVPAYVSVPAAKQDMDRYINLYSLEVKIAAILSGIQHARMASGSEVLLFVKALYASLAAAAEQNVPGAAALYNELKQYFDLPSQPDGEATPPTP